MHTVYSPHKLIEKTIFAPVRAFSPRFNPSVEVGRRLAAFPSSGYEVPRPCRAIRVLHQVYDRCLATGHKHACVAVQPFLDHRTQRVGLVHRRIFGPEVLGARIGGLVATKVRYRIRSFIDMRLRSVRGCEHEVITSFDQGHRRNDGFVEIIASRTRAAALHLNASGIGTEHKDFALGHLNSSFPSRSEGFLDLVVVKMSRHSTLLRDGNENNSENYGLSLSQLPEGRYGDGNQW